MHKIPTALRLGKITKGVSVDREGERNKDGDWNTPILRVREEEEPARENEKGRQTREKEYQERVVSRNPSEDSISRRSK